MPSRNFGTTRAHWRRSPALTLVSGVAVLFAALATAHSVSASDDDPGDVTHAIPMPALKVGFPVSAGSAFQRPPMLVDLDQDHRYEILAVEQSGIIHVVRADGTEPKKAPAKTTAAPPSPTVPCPDGSYPADTRPPRPAGDGWEWGYVPGVGLCWSRLVK